MEASTVNPMSIMNPEAVFPQVEKMLYHMAWKFSNDYPIPFEEAKAECYYAFVRACADYKETRGSKFSSWCYFWAWTHMKTFVTKRTVDPLVFVEINEELVGEAPPITLNPRTAEVIEDLSEDAKEIISLIFETSTEGVVTVKQLFRRVKKSMAVKWKSKERVEKAEEEIRTRLSLAWA